MIFFILELLIQKKTKKSEEYGLNNSFVIIANGRNLLKACWFLMVELYSLIIKKKEKCAYFIRIFWFY